MRNLSKSKIIAWRQCPKRLWLEVHRPELRDDTGSEAAFAIGHEVGDAARLVYDTDGKGVFLNLDELSFSELLARSAELLESGSVPVFEAGFTGGGGLALADVMLPEPGDSRPRWHMIEVKASTSVKDYHRDDVAVQSCIADAAGIDLASVSLAHIDNSFVYPGGGDYRGLFHEEDLTEETRQRRGEAAGWIAAAQQVAAGPREPAIDTGPHCSDPFGCPFLSHCEGAGPATDHPLDLLPRLHATQRARWQAAGIVDLCDVPDTELNAQQLRVKEASLSGQTFFDRSGAAAELAPHGFPAWFLDFETVAFPVPIWKGTRPYQQLPFQYSLHRVDSLGNTTHQAFLVLDGHDPREALARSLVAHCGHADGPVFVYNAAFERRVMRELGRQFPKHAAGLEQICKRLVDLLPITRNHYYHPDQCGSWSIKAVLPCMVPELSYTQLEGIAEGAMAATAFREAIAQSTTEERRLQIERELLAYCHLDTLAMVRMWEVLRGAG